MEELKVSGSWLVGIQNLVKRTEDQRVVAIIQARMGSTRLPAKTLIEICGKPVLQHIIERVQHCELIEEIVVATTENKEDYLIVELCEKLGVKSFTGSESDVLDRFYRCAKKFNADIVVRVTADDPFKDPEVIDKAIRELISDKGLDYVSNTIKPTYPEGIDIEVFAFNALERAWKEAVRISEREHVTPYIWSNPEIFRVSNFENDINLSNLRWTLDTPQDLEFTREVYKRLYCAGRVFLLKDILALLHKEPELSRINSGIERNAGYKKSILKEKIS